MGYYTPLSSRIGLAPPTYATGVHDLEGSLLYPQPATGTQLYNFFTSSAPAGIYTTTSAVGTYLYGWSATYGLQTAGDAGTGFVYTVQTQDSFTGNYLIQASFYYGGSDNCPDPSIAIWPASNGRTAPLWDWAASATRISAQNNCASYLAIYGLTAAATGTAFTYTQNTWYTMHFYHEPSLARSRYVMTLGQNDWTKAGTVAAAEVTGSGAGYYITGQSFYVGLASDADGYALGASSCNFSGLRISPL